MLAKVVGKVMVDSCLDSVNFQLSMGIEVDYFDEEVVLMNIDIDLNCQVVMGAWNFHLLARVAGSLAKVALV